MDVCEYLSVNAFMRIQLRLQRERKEERTKQREEREEDARTKEAK